MDSLFFRVSPKDPLFEANYLTGVRWGLAGAVMIAHAWEVNDGMDPLGVYNWQASDLAVNGFFILSGMLIAKSLATRRHLGDYFKSRFLRLFPALALVVIASLLFFGPVFSPASEGAFLKDSQAWDYVTRIFGLMDPRGEVAGAFSGNSEPHLNAPLWTIRFEVFCYILVGAAFAIGLLKNRLVVLGMFLVFSLISMTRFMPEHSFLSLAGYDFFRLTSAFLLGVLLFYVPELRRPRLMIVLICAVLFLLFGRLWFSEIFANVFLALGILYAGFYGRHIPSLAKLPDYSYGIYIWHYPILQALEYSVPSLQSWQLLVVATPLVLICSGLSWHFAEKPALGLKNKKFLNVPKRL